MNTKETIARLSSILHFYKNDGYFIAEGEAEEEQEALEIAIRCVEENYELHQEIENLKQDIVDLCRYGGTR